VDNGLIHLEDFKYSPPIEDHLILVAGQSPGFNECVYRAMSNYEYVIQYLQIKMN
jgi:hypothetical protein